MNIAKKQQQQNIIINKEDYKEEEEEEEDEYKNGNPTFKIVITAFDDSNHSGYSPIPKKNDKNNVIIDINIDDIPNSIDENPEIDKYIIKPKEKQLKLLKQEWYYDGRKTKPFGREEIYFDFIEYIDCIFNKFGGISWFQTRGIITFKSDLSETILIHLLTNDLRNWRYSNMSIKKLQNSKIKYINLEYTSFHECVNIHGWTKRRQIYFTPPNGIQFVLMSYRITSKYLDSNIIPFRCYTKINYNINKKCIIFRVTFQNNINSSNIKQPRYSAKLFIPLIINKIKCIQNIICIHGIYQFYKDKNDNNNEYIIWNIYDVQQYEPMIFQFEIANINNKYTMNQWLTPNIGKKPVINIQFKFIKAYLFSSFNIEQYTAHDKNNKLKTLRIWKRKQAMNGHCIVQLT